MFSFGARDMMFSFGAREIKKSALNYNIATMNNISQSKPINCRVIMMCQLIEHVAFSTATDDIHQQ